jgi:hypothetical protein
MAGAPNELRFAHTSTHLEISAEALDGAELHGVSPHTLGFRPWAPPEYPPSAGQDDRESGLDATQLAHAPTSNPTPSTCFSNGMPSYDSWDMAWSASQSNSQPVDTTMTPSSDYPDPPSRSRASQTEPAEIDCNVDWKPFEDHVQQAVLDQRRADSAALAPLETFPAPQAPQADHRGVDFGDDQLCSQSTADLASRSSLAAAGEAETAAPLMQANNDDVDGSSRRESPLDRDSNSGCITGNTSLASMPRSHPKIPCPNMKSQSTTPLPTLAPKPAPAASITCSTSTRPSSALSTSINTRKRKSTDGSGRAKIRKVHVHQCIRCKLFKQQVSC